MAFSLLKVQTMVRPSRKRERLIVSVSIILTIIGSTSCGARNTPDAPKPTTTASPFSSFVVITGTFVRADGSPISGSGTKEGCSADAAVCVVVVQVRGSRGKGANTIFDIATIPGSHGDEPNKDGEFSIELARDSLPTGSKFLVATMSMLGGLEPLRVNGNPVVFEIDDRSERVELGRITLKG
jgi:hypothetical protein